MIDIQRVQVSFLLYIMSGIYFAWKNRNFTFVSINQSRITCKISRICERTFSLAFTRDFFPQLILTFFFSRKCERKWEKRHTSTKSELRIRLFICALRNLYGWIEHKISYNLTVAFKILSLQSVIINNQKQHKFFILHVFLYVFSRDCERKFGSLN